MNNSRGHRGYVKLNNWGVLSNKSNGGNDIRLYGNTQKHERFKDGSFIFTSLVKHINGVFVTTESNTLYKLGSVDIEYIKNLFSSGVEVSFDPKNPLEEFKHLLENTESTQTICEKEK
jgi:hypothetical protein